MTISERFAQIADLKKIRVEILVKKSVLDGLHLIFAAAACATAAENLSEAIAAMEADARTLQLAKDAQQPLPFLS